ncbi:hypothetical protein B0T18DRAFT_389891 [Schizothecium vesticola]|uniref:Uncharacterized protein n=1 Tax=Schizothecium vesticola TaxID=314040 RepID=A0AA40F3S7_9PEZI|nr:hypothetical protein B0T18DRAFT_389891 [Schizothecium vesticola]
MPDDCPDDDMPPVPGLGEHQSHGHSNPGYYGHPFPMFENLRFVNPSLLEVSNPPNSDWQHQSWNFNAFHVTDESHGFGSETDCDFLPEWLSSDTDHVGIITSDNIPEQAYVPLALSGQDSKLLKQTVEREQEEILVRRRAEGIGFNHIADEISLKTGVKVTRNALVKRYQKILDSYLVPVAEATKIAMPGIMSVIERELGKLTDLNNLSEEDKAALEGLRKELPRIVQNRALRKRKAILSMEE